MRILFVNQTNMVWYRGENKFDHPVNGGEWIKNHGADSADVYNFQTVGGPGDEWPIHLNNGEEVKIDGTLCVAYISTGSKKDGTPKTLHLEKIRDCQGCGKADYIDDVFVVFCARNPKNAWPTVVGWYRHAYVFRYHLNMAGPNGESIFGNIIAKAEDVTLLPEEKRNWRVYRAAKGGLGFGQSNYWFANEGQDPKVKGYVNDIVRKIEQYDGDNLMDYELCLNCGSIVPKSVRYCDQCGTKMFWNARSGAADMGLVGFDPFLDVARLVTQKGIANLTIEELQALWKGSRYTAATIGHGWSALAAEDAAEVAMFRLLKITRTTKGLLLIVVANEKALDLQKVKQARDAVRHIADDDGEDFEILVGAAKDNGLKDDEVRVTLIACE